MQKAIRPQGRSCAPARLKNFPLKHWSMRRFSAVLWLHNYFRIKGLAALTSTAKSIELTYNCLERPKIDTRTALVATGFAIDHFRDHRSHFIFVHHHNSMVFNLILLEFLLILLLFRLTFPLSFALTFSFTLTSALASHLFLISWQPPPRVPSRPLP